MWNGLSEMTLQHKITYPFINRLRERSGNNLVNSAFSRYLFYCYASQ